ncbi:hypothetical protein ACFL5Q_07855, partial [Planctomycetota bacterium]
MATVVGAFAQAPAPGAEPAVETVTAEVVETRRQQAEQAADLDDAIKQKVLQTYDQAAGMLDSAAKSAARVAELQALIDTADAQTADFIQQLAGLGTASPEPPTGQEDLREIKRIRAEKDDAFSKAKETLAALTAETARRISSRKEIPGLIAASREQLAKLNEQLLAPAIPDTPPFLVLAQRTVLLAQRQALEQSIAADEKELTSYDATAELLPLQQRVATARVTLLEQETSKWREVENRLMELDAKRQADQARQETVEA